MIPDKDVIATQLQLLPNEIAATATQILTLQTDKIELDTKIAEIETTVKFSVGTNLDLKNDTARRAATQDMLNQNTDYKLRDQFNALIAIAGME